MISSLTSIVIVNFNGIAFLRECLTSLERQSLPRHLFEVIVVDNASRDGSCEMLKSDFPWVRVIALAENRGFAGGNNAGFAAAHGEFIALLNNDTHADPYWLQNALASVELGVGGIASKLVFHAEPQRINSAGLRLLADGRGSDLGFRTDDNGQFEQIAEVFAGCGAALLLRRAVIDETNGFDERFFMYCEDLDLAWQSQINGWKFVYQPSSVVRHVHCGSSGEWSPFFTYHLERNRVWVNLRNADLFLAMWTLLGFVARIGRSLLRRKRGLIRAYLRAGLSVLTRLPTFLAERYSVRTLSSRTSR